jgi:hypothetical protein
MLGKIAAAAASYMLVRTVSRAYFALHETLHQVQNF